MRIEIIPTRNGKVFLEFAQLTETPKVNPDEWNKAIDKAITYLRQQKLDKSGQFRRASEE